MPDSDEHKVKAERNHKFVQTMLKIPDQEDWLVNGLFYAAVHLVERLRFHTDTTTPHSTDHEHRYDFVRSKFPSNIRIAYRKLYDASLIARYKPHERFLAAFPDRVDVESLASNDYESIRIYITRELKGVGVS